MNLASLLAEREASAKPIRVALIGAGKFGTMILAQLRLMRGVRLAVLADLDATRALAAAERAGWQRPQFSVAESLGAANDVARAGGCALVPAGELAAACDVDVVIEATGHEEAAARHAARAIDAGNHVIMVSVEADVVVGPILARRAERAGVVYSLAYGDQPAMICELVDWARTCGFTVVAAGKGTKYLPAFRRSTPDRALELYGFTPQEIAGGDFNPKMFNSFLDGTKSAIEMAAVANATGLGVAEAGLSFTPCAPEALPTLLKPARDGGILPGSGYVDVISSLDAGGATLPQHLRWGVFVTFTSDSPYAVRCFREYGLATDASGRFAAMWRPYHLIGLEIGISVASVVCRREPTGTPRYGPLAEVVAGARAALPAGSTIDGEGGFACYGTVVPAALARERKLVPMGLAHGLKLKHDVAADHLLGEADVAFDDTSFLWQLRKEQDRAFAPERVATPA